MKDTFLKRIAIGDPHEKKVFEHLKIDGWAPYWAGQAIFPPELRNGLRDFRHTDGSKCLLRWAPEIIATKGDQIIAVDPKAGRQDTGNWCVEQDSLRAAVGFQGTYRIRWFFVFGDGTAITATMLDTHPEWRWEGFPEPGRTDYWLFSKTHTFPFFSNWD